MFTGLIQAIGSVVARSDGRVTLMASFASDLTLGESISVSGVCLTVIRIQDPTFEVDVSPTTEALTTAGTWEPGSTVNLERALAVGDRLGGHIVTGHVDGTGTLAERVPASNCERLRFEAPSRLAAHLVEQGSIAIDGVSLTLNSVGDPLALRLPPTGEPAPDSVSFWVTIIPQTSSNTTLSRLACGARVNLETDILGKYVERALAVRSAEPVGTGR